MTQMLKSRDLLIQSTPSHKKSTPLNVVQQIYLYIKRIQQNYSSKTVDEF